MTACALATQRVGIGVGVFNPYNRHPTLMAMEMGALDEISNGRAILGIGSGVASQINQFTEFRKPGAALRDSVAILRGLLAGEEVTYKGALFSARALKLGYKLYRSDLPILLAAMSDQTLRLCGEIRRWCHHWQHVPAGLYSPRAQSHARWRHRGWTPTPQAHRQVRADGCGPRLQKSTDLG